MRVTITFVLFSAALAAQPAPKSALIGTSQAFFSSAKNNILRSADKIPESLWSFQPTPEVRTIGQLFAHIADGQYEFCGGASDGNAIDKGLEKSVKTKA